MKEVCNFMNYTQDFTGKIIFQTFLDFLKEFCRNMIYNQTCTAEALNVAPSSEDWSNFCLTFWHHFVLHLAPSETPKIQAFLKPTHHTGPPTTEPSPNI